VTNDLRSQGEGELIGDANHSPSQTDALRRERAELARSEARFRTLVEHAPDAIVILDVDTGRFVDVNTNACELFGLPREKLLECGPVDLSPEFQPDGEPSKRLARDAIERAVQGGSPVFEWSHQNARGELTLCEVRLVGLPDAERRLVRGSMIDIRRRKQAEAERARLTAELHQAQKMQAIGQLTGGIAHDFNNLLTVIMGSLELMELDANDSARLRSHAEQAMDAARRAAALTQRLLAFARRQPLRPRALQLNRLIQGTETLLRRTLGETIEVETVFGAGLWHCEADPMQLENVLLNLAINARDAMLGGGRLTIETGNARLDREYARAHQDVQPGQYVMLAVTDNGTGMSPEVLSKVFEPFFTTKQDGKGSGMGLSMAYGFVKQSGGHVNIYSEQGVGTTVRIYLPRILHAVTKIDTRPTEGEPLGDGSLVLIVEDDERVRILVAQMLERLGYRACCASEAEQALKLLEEQDNVELLLTDVVLPGGVNGAELSRRARELRRGLPVLFMSGYTENAIIHNGRLDRGVALIEKPFSRRELALAVHEALTST
jgi:PAS domain S-box-containing protein